MKEQIIDVQGRTADMIVAEIKATEDYAAKSVILAAAKIGQNLKELKELVGHGNFLPYIAENLEYSERKAQQMMQIADHYADENSPYFRVVSNPHTCADLSISKALRLLAVPEEEVETFVEEVDPAALTVKELEQKIKALQEEKEDIGDSLVAAQEDYNRAQKDKETLEKQLLELETKIAEADWTKEGDAEEVQAAHEALEQAKRDAEQARIEKERVEQKIKELKEQIEQERMVQEAQIVAAKAEASLEAKGEAMEIARRQVEIEIKEAKRAAEKAEKKAEKEKQRAEEEAQKAKDAIEKLKTAGKSEKEKMKAAAVLSIRGNLLNETFEEITKVITALEPGPERETLKAAVNQIVDEMGRKAKAL